MKASHYISVKVSKNVIITAYKMSHTFPQMDKMPLLNLSVNTCPWREMDIFEWHNNLSFIGLANRKCYMTADL